MLHKTNRVPLGISAPILSTNDDNLNVTWHVDSTYAPALNEAAASQGVTPQHVAQDVMSYAISQGWSYGVPTGVSTIFFSHDAIKSVAAALGKRPEEVTGDAVARLIGNLSKPKVIEAQ